MQQKEDRTSKVSIRWNVASKIRRNFYFSKKTVTNILANLNYRSEAKDKLYTILNSPIVLSNIHTIYKFLSDYKGENLNNDFKDFFRELPKSQLAYYFYIYFIYMCFIKKEGFIPRNEQFKTNIAKLFYTEDVEAKFDKQKFRAHFRRHYLNNISLDNELNEELVQEVQQEIPDSLEDELELAIAIYAILCKKFCYSPDYILTSSSSDIPPYEEVNASNHQVICVTFAIIYYKLLKMYNIDANLAGDCLTHMKVNIRIHSMMIEADATNFGFGYTRDYRLSDLANVKLGFPINGFVLANLAYEDYNYVKYNEPRLERVISRVTSKIYDKEHKAIKISFLLYEHQSKLREQKKSRGVTPEEEAAYHIAFLNQLATYKASKAECENKQFISKFSHKLFNNFQGEVKVSLLFKRIEEQIHLYNLYTIKTTNNTIYFLETENGLLVHFEGSALIENIITRNLEFKSEEKQRQVQPIIQNKIKQLKKDS